MIKVTMRVSQKAVVALPRSAIFVMSKPPIGFEAACSALTRFSRILSHMLNRLLGKQLAMLLSSNTSLKRGSDDVVEEEGSVDQ